MFHKKSKLSVFLLILNSFLIGFSQFLIVHHYIVFLDCLIDVLSLQEYLEFLEKIRHHEIESLARKYRAIGPLLTKMEGLVAHTNTGKSPKLSQYYIYWENRIFQSLLKVSYFIFYMNF